MRRSRGGASVVEGEVIRFIAAAASGRDLLMNVFFFFCFFFFELVFFVFKLVLVLVHRDFSPVDSRRRRAHKDGVRDEDVVLHHPAVQVEHCDVVQEERLKAY